jgi:hypothetical protein
MCKPMSLFLLVAVFESSILIYRQFGKPGTTPETLAYHTGFLGNSQDHDFSTFRAAVFSLAAVNIEMDRAQNFFLGVILPKRLYVVESKQALTAIKILVHRNGFIQTHIVVRA